VNIAFRLQKIGAQRVPDEKQRRGGGAWAAVTTEGGHREGVTCVAFRIEKRTRGKIPPKTAIQGRGPVGMSGGKKHGGGGKANRKKKEKKKKKRKKKKKKKNNASKEGISADVKREVGKTWMANIKRARHGRGRWDGPERKKKERGKKKGEKKYPRLGPVSGEGGALTTLRLDSEKDIASKRKQGGGQESAGKGGGKRGKGPARGSTSNPKRKV